MTPTYRELIAENEDLRRELAAVTAERDELKDELDRAEMERNRERRLNYLARGWGP